MQTYVIRRRSVWNSADELKEAAARSRQIGDEEMSDDVRWIRSYVVREADGTLGTHCIYQATGPEASREHAAQARMPADEIEEVVETVIVRPDPAREARRLAARARGEAERVAHVL